MNKVTVHASEVKSVSLPDYVWDLVEKVCSEKDITRARFFLELVGQSYDLEQAKREAEDGIQYYSFKAPCTAHILHGTYSCDRCNSPMKYALQPGEKTSMKCGCQRTHVFTAHKSDTQFWVNGTVYAGVHNE